MPRTTHFFATRADMEPGLRAIEEKHALQYVRRGLFPEPGIEVYATALELPDLGTSHAGDLVLQPRYLVLERSHEVQVRPVPQRRGGILYAVDEVYNHPAMIFVPGGFHGPDCLIAGEVLATGDCCSLRLHQTFTRQLLKDFRRIDGRYVGPEALSFLREGGRLAHGVRRPREVDLVEATSGASTGQGA